jgi:hypothetical protein
MIWRLVQDHVKKDLLFAATEYGIYFTPDGGSKWIKLKGGLPTISFRDLTIQRRENDLVCASFGRGFYILDDYSPLREVTSEGLKKEPTMFPVKDALWYIPRDKWGQGASEYVAQNPPFGAVFSYYLPQELSTLKSARQKKEKELNKEGKDIPFPGWEALDKEQQQQAPEIRLTIKDNQGNVVKTIKGKTSKGIHRTSWDLRYASKLGVRFGQEQSDWGPMVVPSTYTVSLSKVIDGKVTEMSESRSFEVKPLRKAALEGASADEWLAYKKEIEQIQQDFMATSDVLEKSLQRIKAMQVAIMRVDKESKELQSRIHETALKLQHISILISGSPSMNEAGEQGAPTPGNRLSVAVRGLSTTYGPTEMHKQSLEISKSGLAEVKAKLAEIVDVTLPQLEKDLKDAGAPWIEGQGLIKK